MASTEGVINVSPLANLDVALSTRNAEVTQLLVKTDLDNILARLDVALSTRASQTTVASILTDLDNILAKLDVNLSTVATQATLALIKAKTDNLDVALSTRINTLGQKIMASSTPVVIASDQSRIDVHTAGLNYNAQRLYIQPTNQSFAFAQVVEQTHIETTIPCVIYFNSLLNNPIFLEPNKIYLSLTLFQTIYFNSLNSWDMGILTIRGQF